MKIISTNIGKPQTIEWRGNQIQTGIYKNSVNHPIFLESEDVLNDHVMDRRYHGGTDKACYLYSADHYKMWSKLYPDVEMPWGMFGENLTVKGLNEAEINIGDTFQIGNAVVQATQPRQPCFKLGIRFGSQNIVNQFIDSGFAGVYVRVLQKGEVKTGDSFVLTEKKNSLSIQKIFELLYTTDFENEKENAQKAINEPLLAKSCRKDLIKRWEKFL
jgi:MOSC domain-containing protein YiiM